MANYILLSLVGGLLLLLWLTWKSPQSNLKLRESLFRNVGVGYRNFIALLLGATAALLPLTSETWSISTAIWVFVIALAMTMFLLIVVRPISKDKPDRFSWGLFVIILLGFGLGALIYQTRSWWIWLWNKYRLINEPHELLLEALFLLGVVLGVFVVRNWGKEDKAFLESLAGVLGGTFIATLLGQIQANPLPALAYYMLGFTMSGGINLLLAARLTANYTNKRSISSRALLDFLYGSERTKIIDGYFLKNFEEDTDYARRFLQATLLEYRKLARREFAKAMNRRMKLRVKRRSKTIRLQCEDLQKLYDSAKQLRDEINAFPVKLDAAQKEEKQDKERLLDKVNQDVRDQESKLKPSFFYELFSIECVPETDARNSAPAVNDLDMEYNVIYKRLDDDKPLSDDERVDDDIPLSDDKGPDNDDKRLANYTSTIQENMFRVSVAMHHKDVLEYIIAPGQYRASFPFIGSVAGLALTLRQTIIMDRDRNRKFRSRDYRDGICPRDIEQLRGLDEIDFLSYIAIPVVSRLGRSNENPLGIVNIDTKIFVTHCELGGQPVEGTVGMFRKQLTRSQLNEYASNLYDREDKDVEYIEKLTKIIEPILELYAKCRVGAP